MIYSGLCYLLACKPLSLCHELHWMGQVWSGWHAALPALAVGPRGGARDAVSRCVPGGSHCLREPFQRDLGAWLCLPREEGVCNAFVLLSRADSAPAGLFTHLICWFTLAD